jgi:hypothetical protein
MERIRIEEERRNFQEQEKLKEQEKVQVKENSWNFLRIF